MGQITTGVGLISGLDINNIVEQLIAIDSRPRNLVQQRNAVIQSQQVAFQDINARLLALKGSADAISGTTSFSGTTSSSSNESVLSVSSGIGATPGTYSFTVGRLVAAQQSITRGFQDSDVTPVASSGGTLRFDRGESRLDSESRLSNFNGGAGVDRGFVRITDRSGSTSVVDLRAVVSADDVVEKINSATGVNVIAEINGDGFQITDASGGTGDLIIGNVGTTATATSLGIAGNSTADGDGDDAVLTGTNINSVGNDTLLTSLNDGKGIRDEGGNDLVINYSGGAATVDLSDLLTLEDVFDAIDTATGGVVTASTNANGTGIQLSDSGGSGAGFNVTSGNGSNALVDLGLSSGQADSDADGVISGGRVIASINSKLLKDLRGGSGLSAVTTGGAVPLQATTNIADFLQGAGLSSNGAFSGDFRITDKNGGSADFNIDAHTNIGTLINSINANVFVDVSIAIDGQTLTITDTSGGSGNLVVSDINGATAATELGIVIDADVTSVTSIDVDPAGTPVADATFSITDSLGSAASVDLIGAQTVQDILDRINNAGRGCVGDAQQRGQRHRDHRHRRRLGRSHHR